MKKTAGKRFVAPTTCTDALDIDDVLARMSNLEESRAMCRMNNPQMADAFKSDTDQVSHQMMMSRTATTGALATLATAERTVFLNENGTAAATTSPIRNVDHARGQPSSSGMYSPPRSPYSPAYSPKQSPSTFESNAGSYSPLSQPGKSLHNARPGMFSMSPHRPSDTASDMPGITTMTSPQWQGNSISHTTYSSSSYSPNLRSPELYSPNPYSPPPDQATLSSFNATIAKQTDDATIIRPEPQVPSATASGGAYTHKKATPVSLTAPPDNHAQSQTASSWSSTLSSAHLGVPLIGKVAVSGTCEACNSENTLERTDEGCVCQQCGATFGKNTVSRERNSAKPITEEDATIRGEASVKDSLHLPVQNYHQEQLIAQQQLCCTSVQSRAFLGKAMGRMNQQVSHGALRQQIESNRKQTYGNDINAFNKSKIIQRQLQKIIDTTGLDLHQRSEDSFHDDLLRFGDRIWQRACRHHDACKMERCKLNLYDYEVSMIANVCALYKLKKWLSDTSGGHFRDLLSSALHQVNKTLEAASCVRIKQMVEQLALDDMERLSKPCSSGKTVIRGSLSKVTQNPHISVLATSYRTSTPNSDLSSPVDGESVHSFGTMDSSSKDPFHSGIQGSSLGEDLSAADHLADNNLVSLFHAMIESLDACEIHFKQQETIFKKLRSIPSLLEKRSVQIDAKQLVAATTYIMMQKRSRHQKSPDLTALSLQSGGSPPKRRRYSNLEEKLATYGGVSTEQLHELCIHLKDICKELLE